MAFIPSRAKKHNTDLGNSKAELNIDDGYVYDNSGVFAENIFNAMVSL